MTTAVPPGVRVARQHRLPSAARTALGALLLAALVAARAIHAGDVAPAVARGSIEALAPAAPAAWLALPFVHLLPLLTP